jgi:recombination protein RecT
MATNSSPAKYNSNTAIEVKQNQKDFAAIVFSQKVQEKIARHFTDEFQKQKFVDALISIYMSNADLQKCEPQSIIYAAVKAAELGLPLNSMGYAYVIPYGNKAQFQISYRGLLRLAMRSGLLTKINVVPVTNNYLVDYTEVGDLRLIKTADNPTSPDIVGFFGYLEYKTGFTHSIYKTTEELMKHGQKFSKTFNSVNSIWKTHFEEMATKTIIKNLLSRYMMDEDLKYIDAAIEADQAIFEEDDFSYPDNPINKGLDREADEMLKRVLDVESPESIENTAFPGIADDDENDDDFMNS